MPPSPNTFLIGAPKCGTTSLASYLADHPNVFFSNPKETLYWCRDFVPYLRSHEPRYTDLAQYLELFAGADPTTHQVVAEGSTRYLHSSVAVQDIVAYQPNAKFIAMVRNPVDLVPSYHGEQVYQLYESQADFATAWYSEAELGDTKPSPFLSYRQSGRLGEQLAKILELIDREQLLVILFDDFSTNPGAIYEKVLRFLELPQTGRTEFPKLNSAHGHRSKWIASLVLNPPRVVAGPVLRFRQYLARRRYPPIEFVKSQLNQKKPRETLDDRVLQQLRDEFRDDIDMLAELIGRDLSDWITTAHNLAPQPTI